MSANRDDDEPLNVFDTLLMPLRLPGRVISDIETLASAVVSLQSDAEEHLSSIDASAAQLVEGLGELRSSIDRIESRVNKLEKERMAAFLEAVEKLQTSIDRIDGRVELVETVEETMTTQLQGVRSDLNERMIAVEHEVRAIRPAMERMAQDVAKIDQLLPDPSDGPLTRLKDTLTSSG